VPRAALAGVLLLVAYGMIDRARMARILRGARGDAVIMLVTFLGMLLLSIEFAVLAGILLSLGYYILKTSAPQVHAVLPDANFKHLVQQPGKAHCPQLAILDIHGDLYFGAVSHVDNALYEHRARHPEQRFLLLRMHGVNLCDFSGIRMLESTVRAYRQRGGDVFLTRVRGPVRKFMNAIGFSRYLGADHFLQPDAALEYLFYNVLDPAICIYESDVRVFAECQNLPRPEYRVTIPLYTEVFRHDVPTIAAQQLWEQLHSRTPPQVLDVREPREYQEGHIPQAQLIPLPTLLSKRPDLPRERCFVFVCRGGRRSTRAAHLFRNHGYKQVAVLAGGMQAWEAARLLEAVGDGAGSK
jgi:SulP family sulfate permease